MGLERRSPDRHRGAPHRACGNSSHPRAPYRRKHRTSRPAPPAGGGRSAQFPTLPGQRRPRTLSPRKATHPPMNKPSAIGYDQPLFIQPFDHRGSFTKSYFGFRGAPEISPGNDGFGPVAAAKSLIYRGLLRAIEGGVPKEQVGILVDAQFGSQVLADAAARGIPRAVCIEKSGQSVFDFEYGVRWVTHIRYHRPQIVKVLVRLHPDDPVADTAVQLSRLQLVSDYLHGPERRLFMFELLVPATTPEDKEAGAAYDRDLRPGHMVRAIHMIQDFGIEPDIWKIEGVDRAEDAEKVAAAVRSGPGRERVGSIVLGRGSDAAQVHEWLRVAAPVDGFIGFAVGRTNFREPLGAYLNGQLPEADAIAQIAANYRSCVDTWRAAKG
ncbi:MAG: DUF2090 domain-containing protein [Acidobacteria bacterium]|nr:DUF2090 domain-containing protein [Acidobacteriota bacterium]MYA46052.1 DUF2090 domain-containing protein [Acidobacteriota bacterium]